MPNSYKKRKKKVYIALSGDILHHGHINLINKAKKYGDLTIGLLTDKAVMEKKRLPMLNWEQRKKVLENIEGVKNVIKQDEWNYTNNLQKIKPDFFVHGDDWKAKNSYDYDLRIKVLNILKKIKYKLVEVPYTKDVSSSLLYDKLRYSGVDKNLRKNFLRRIIQNKKICRFIEAHSPLSALIAEKAVYKESNGIISEFDGFWSSSLTDSTLRGRPDIEVLDLSKRLSNINEILEVTTKPLIMDADTGGKPEHFEINIKSIERLGISAAIIEDKKGLKKNSLIKNSKQSQENIRNFCKKIEIGKRSCSSKEFMIIARVESFILNKGLEDAFKRSSAYINAGADGIMIHSKKETAKEILDFTKKFKSKFPDIPLVAVPTSYNKIKEDILQKEGVNIVIYANHLLRACYPAMIDATRQILKNKKTYELEKKLLTIKDILKLIPGTI